MDNFLNSIIFTPKSRFDVTVVAAIFSFAVSINAKVLIAVGAGKVVDRSLMLFSGLGIFSPPLPAAFITAKLSGPAPLLLLDGLFTGGADLVLIDSFFHVEPYNLCIAPQSVAFAIS